MNICFILRAQLQTHFLTKKCTPYPANLTLVVKVFPNPDYCKEMFEPTPVKNPYPVPIVPEVLQTSQICEPIYRPICKLRNTHAPDAIKLLVE